MNPNLLTNEQLHSYRRTAFIRHAKHSVTDLGGQKMDLADTTTSVNVEESVQLYRNKLFEKLQWRKVTRVCDLCRIDYNSQNEQIILTKKVGRSYRFAGYTGIDGHTLLDPEEALFLLDSGAAEMYCDRFPIGFSAALRRMTKDFDFTVEHYLVYSNLNRAGFIVRRYVRDKNRYQKPANSMSTNTAKTLEKPRNSYTDNASLAGPSNGISPPEVNQQPTYVNPRYEAAEPVSVPNDFGKPEIHLRPVPSELLPVEIDYFPGRLYLAYRNFSASRCKSSLQQASWSDIDEKRRREKRIFYKSNRWPNFSARHMRSWQEYKSFKRSLSVQNLSRCETQGPKNAENRSNAGKSENENGGRFKIIFDVHLSDRAFSTSCPPRPLFHLVVLSSKEPPPKIEDVNQLIRSASETGIDIKYAVIDNGDVAYFSFDLTPVPILV